MFFIWICADVGSPTGHNHMNHPFSSSPYIPKSTSSQALVDPFSLFSPLLFSSSFDSGRIAHFVSFFPRNHVAQLDFQWLRSFAEVPRHLGERCFSKRLNGAEAAMIPGTQGDPSGCCPEATNAAF